MPLKQSKVLEDIDKSCDFEGQMEDLLHGYLMLHLAEHLLLVFVHLEDIPHKSSEATCNLFDHLGDVVAQTAEIGVMLCLFQIDLQEDGGEEDVVVVLDLDGGAFVDLLQAALKLPGLALDVLQVDGLETMGGGGRLLVLAVLCELLLRFTAFYGFDQFQVGVVSACAVLVGGLLDVLTRVSADIVLQFFGFDVGWFLGMEICLFEALGLFLNDGSDVVGDDDYLTIPQLFHELVLDVLHKFTVLYLQYLLTMVEDYDRVGLALLGELLQFIHLLGDDVFLLESQLQQCLNVALVFVLEIYCEVFGEDLAVHYVDPRLLHEIRLAGEFLPLQEEVRNALVVGQVLFYEGKHLALYSQDVVLPESLGRRPSLVVVKLLLAVAKEVFGLLIRKRLFRKDTKLLPLARLLDLTGVHNLTHLPILPLLILNNLILDLMEELPH